MANKILRFLSWHLGIWNRWYRQELVRRYHPKMWKFIMEGEEWNGNQD